jgi:hypothetical protein
MTVKEPELIVQFMTLVEDFTPIKPVTGKGNTFEEGMFLVGMFGVKHEHVLMLAAIGLVYVLMIAK